MTMQLRKVLFVLSSIASLSAGDKLCFEEDHDKNCSSIISECKFDPNVWHKCPVSCAKHFEPTRAHRFHKIDDPEKFYALSAVDSNGKTVDFENFNGYVTMVALVPTFPGMAQYYYDMLEHLNSVYPYTMEIIFVPTGDDHCMVSEHSHSRILMLEHDSKSVASYFRHMERKESVSCFIVSVNGDSLNALYSPSYHQLQEFVTMNLHGLDKPTREF